MTLFDKGDGIPAGAAGAEEEDLFPSEAAGTAEEAFLSPALPEEEVELGLEVQGEVLALGLQGHELHAGGPEVGILLQALAQPAGSLAEIRDL